MIVHQIIVDNILDGKELRLLCGILKPHGEFKFVGGCVRDIFLGKEIGDIDIATEVLPHDLVKILESHRIKVVLTGVDFGTITAVINGHHFEITTLRRDVQCYGRKARVAFTQSWMEDAARRDFTMNALYLDTQGNVMDFFGGVDDLRKRVIRFIGDPMARIREDYLRILRYFRLHSLMGVQNIDRDSLQATTELAEGLKEVSGERVRDEMFKMLRGEFASEAFDFFSKSNLHQLVALSCIDFPVPIRFVFSNALVNLASILKKGRATVEDLKALSLRWRLSNQQLKYLTHLLSYQYIIPMDEDLKLHKREYYNLGRDLFEANIMLQATIANDSAVLEVAKRLISQSKEWNFPNFPVKGDDLLEIGLEGALLGRVKQKLTAEWIESDFSKSKNELLSSVVKYN